MDKFGIFNILNSFLKSSTDTTEQTSAEEKGENNLLSTLFSALKNNLSDKSTVPKKENSNSPAPTQKTKNPLQSSMLNTMSTHDLFIKRVKEKSPPIPR